MATITASDYNSNLIALIPKNTMGIYCIKNNKNGKLYIGQSVDIRRRIMAQFRWNKRANCAIGRAILKYGQDLFSVEILEVCKFRKDLNLAEDAWIKKKDTICPKGYNMVSGGNARTHISDSTREKMSLSHIGHKRTKESIEKQRKKTIGTKRSPETLLKMSAWQKGISKPECSDRLRNLRKGQPSPNKGKTTPDHVKEKIRIAKTGVPALWRNKPLVRSDGVLFESIQAAALAIGAHRCTLMKHLSGKLKTVHGCTFSRGGGLSQL